MPSVCPHCRASLNTNPLPANCPICGQSLQALTGRTGAVAAQVVGFPSKNVPPTLSSVASAPRLLIQNAEGKSEFTLEPVTRIGRHPINNLKISDREISKEHAEITRQGVEFWIEDLGSSNGTFVNGRRIQKSKLRDGDEILVGTTTMVFKGSVAPAASAGVTMVQSLSPHVLASMRPEDPNRNATTFRPEREITDDKALRTDYEKLRIANEFHQKVGLERNIEALYNKILGVAFDMLNADNGVVLLFDEQKALQPASIRRKKGSEEVNISKTLLDKVVQSREGVLTQDAIIDNRFSASASIISQGIRSAMAVPLLSKGELKGVLYIDTRERTGAFTEKDLRLLTGVASQAGVAIENAELAKRIEQEAETRAHLSRFLSPHMVEQAQQGKLELTKGGELREITILFADIRGFTSMTERGQAVDVVTLLNEYFEHMVDVIFAHGGVLDKFIGDAIMAMWGSPVKREDDAARAVRAAVDMQEALKVYNQTRVASGKAPIAIGIGINTGHAVVGNMGSSKRLEYTAIGDAVNLASRLCSTAVPGQIIVSENTLKLAGAGIDSRPLPPTKVKGKEKPVTIFEVLSYDDEDESTRAAPSSKRTGDD